MMTTIQVSQLFGSICVDTDEGATLCERVRDVLSMDDRVLLDFEGVDTLTSSFLNAAVGCLYAAFSANELERGLRWTGLDETDEAILRLVMKNATRFYEADQKGRAIMTAVSTDALNQ
jgi:STAS-like domain of unknown function (DUF4325)